MMSYKGTFYRLLFFILCLSVFHSCTWEKENGNPLYDLIYLSRNGADMPAHIHGNADSKVFVIVLHGGPGGNGLLYRPGVFSDVLEKDYAMVYLDQRGQGMSQGHLNAETSSVEEMVEDIHALRKVIAHKYGEENSFFLLGHSWGGTLGTAYLTSKDYQKEFDGWIEVDGAHDFDLLLKAQLKMFPLIGNKQIAKGNSVDFWNETIETISKVDSLNYSDEDIIDLNEAAYEAEEKLLADNILRDGTSDFLSVPLLVKSVLLSQNPLTNFITGNLTANVLFSEHDLFKLNLRSKLYKIEIPTLLLWGKYDFVVPPALGEQAFNNISSEIKELIIYEESGHSPMSSEGQEFADAVIEFIESNK